MSSKQFQSIRSCRQHMISKCHCVYNFDDEVEEFYSPETAIVPLNYTVDELGELHGWQVCNNNNKKKSSVFLSSFAFLFAFSLVF